MKNVYGNSLTLTLFGESHGKCVGAVLDGIAPGIKIDTDYINEKLALRSPANDIGTSRHEPDEFSFESGVLGGYTTGAPLCIIIPNTDIEHSSYSEISHIARPGHCDYPAFCKYHGFEDTSGGGHLSGRLTAAIVAAGAILQYALEQNGIYIATHILSIKNICDRSFDFENITEDIDFLRSEYFAVLDSKAKEKMLNEISKAKEKGDSVGGILETAVFGLPKGLGEPWFDGVESMLSKGLFAIPAVKGVEFGDGFALTNLYGSEANDSYIIKDGKILTETNRNGGIGGGITNGMPIVFHVAVKPTPSIKVLQKTVDYKSLKEAEISVKGRHDPSIVPRARAVIDAVTSLTVADILALRFGTDYLAKAVKL